MLTIRLQRTGRKNQANFRVVVAEKTAAVSKKFLEVLGSYNPHKKEFSLKNGERLQYWISQKVEFSPTVHNLLVEKGLLKAGKVKAFNVPKKTEAAENKADAAASAEAAPKEEAAAKAEEEPKAEETKIETPSENSEEAASENKAE